MKAIETRWNGRTFRSRLEARWAIFYDALGVRYDYEPEGFRFDDGTMYLPDFYFPDLGSWAEIKAGAPTSVERSKCAKLAAYGLEPVYLFGGGMPAPTFDPGSETVIGYPTARLYHPLNDGFVEEDEPYTWSWGGSIVYADHADVPIEDYELALSARFEHGAVMPHGFQSAGDVIERLRRRGRTARAINRGELILSAKPRPEGSESA